MTNIKKVLLSLSIFAVLSLFLYNSAIFAQSDGDFGGKSKNLISNPTVNTNWATPAAQGVELMPTDSLSSEETIEYLLKITRNESLSVLVRQTAFWVLGDIARNPEQTDIIKEKIISSLAETAKQPGFNLNLKKAGLLVLGDIARDTAVGDSLKQKIAASLVGVVDAKPEDEVRKTSLAILSNIVSDTNVSDAVKQAVVDLLTKK